MYQCLVYFDNVFFSARSKENLVTMIEKGWGKWSEKEEKYKFWKKVNDKLSEVKNEKLKKRLHHFIMKIVDKPRSKTWIKSKEGKQKTNESKGRKRKTKTVMF